MSDYIGFLGSSVSERLFSHTELFVAVSGTRISLYKTDDFLSYFHTLTFFDGAGLYDILVVFIACIFYRSQM